MIRKGINYFLLLASFYVSKLLKRPVIWGKPAGISIEPTTTCNLECPECPSGLRIFTRNTGMLKPDLFQQILHQVSNTVFMLILYFQGEPLLNKHIYSYIALAKKKRVYTMISTNANKLDDAAAKKLVESGLSKLIISMDGTTQEVYEQYRRTGNLLKAQEGLMHVLKWKKTLNVKYPKVYLQFLVTSKNEHQIPEIKKLGKEWGVDKVTLKTAQFYEYENGNELMPKNPQYSRYKKGKDGKYHIQNSLDNSCWRMWQGSVITWDGLVVPCCFDKDAKHVLGDLKKNSFDEIWRSEQYNQFRKAILKNRQGIDICENCTEGTKVWV